MSLIGKTTGKTLRGHIKALNTIRGYSAYEIAVINGFSGTEEEWLKSLELSPAEVDEAVTKYLEENPVAIDETLTKEGEAADAKVTGDAIRNISDVFVNGHITNKENPHNVTASQVGLGNVNNTSDTDKPVSTAQRKAIVDRFQVGTTKPNSNTLWFNKKENLDDTTDDAHIMAHDLNMAQHNLYGLPRPTADDQAANKGYVDTAKEAAKTYTNEQVKKAAPRNLLDNSYFPKNQVVNQRGNDSYSGNVYGIDRWKGDSGECVVTLLNNGVTVTGDHLCQIIPNSDNYRNKVLTFALCDSAGNIETVNKLIPASITKDWLVQKKGLFNFGFWMNDGGYIYACFMNADSSNPIVWAAVYEGEYTIDTLPKYQPKGYGAELAECQRYYMKIGRGYCQIGFGVVTSETSMAERIFIPTPNVMRTSPSITFDDLTVWRCATANGSLKLTETPTLNLTTNGINLNCKLEKAPGKGAMALHATVGDTYIHFSADL